MIRLWLTLSLLRLGRLQRSVQRHRSERIGPGMKALSRKSRCVQGQLIPRLHVGEIALRPVTGCGPATNDDEWEWQARTFAYDNPRCYRPLGTGPWTATFLSPM